jgi:hypothetical protein
MINWLDSWSEHLNPITVRELRCYSRGYDGVVLFFLSMIVVVSFFLLFFTSAEELFQKKRIIISFFISLGLFGFWILRGIMRSRCIDELLNIVPLSPRQQVHGYWLAFCLFSISYNSIFLPFIALIQLVKPLPYVVLLIPLEIFFFSQISALISLSFVARIKRHWELVWIMVGINYFLILISVLWSGVLWCFNQYHLQVPVWYHGFGFVSLFVLLPIGLLLLGYVAYWLAIYGFTTWRKPLWQSLLLNLFVYTLFGIIVTSFWIGLVFLIQ